MTWRLLPTQIQAACTLQESGRIAASLCQARLPLGTSGIAFHLVDAQSERKITLKNCLAVNYVVAPQFVCTISHGARVQRYAWVRRIYNMYYHKVLDTRKTRSRINLSCTSYRFVCMRVHDKIAFRELPTQFDTKEKPHFWTKLRDIVTPSLDFIGTREDALQNCVCNVMMKTYANLPEIGYNWSNANSNFHLRHISLLGPCCTLNCKQMEAVLGDLFWIVLLRMEKLTITG